MVWLKHKETKGVFDAPEGSVESWELVGWERADVDENGNLKNESDIEASGTGPGQGDTNAEDAPEPKPRSKKD